MRVSEAFTHTSEKFDLLDNLFTDFQSLDKDSLFLVGERQTAQHEHLQKYHFPVFSIKYNM